MKENMNIRDNIEITQRRKNKMRDSLKLRGDVVIERRKKDGTVIDHEELKNLIVNTGKLIVAKMIGNVDSPTAFNSIAIGTGVTVPAVAQTALQTEIIRASVTVAYEADYKCTFEKTFDFGSGEAYAITEAGIFDNASPSGSIMLDRFTFTAKNVDLDTDLYIKITITVA